MTEQIPGRPAGTTTRQQQIAALTRQMLGPAGDAANCATPPRTIMTPQEAALIASVIDKLPPEFCPGSDRARMKLDYLLRELDLEPLDPI